jgi:hypothetical protein
MSDYKGTALMIDAPPSARQLLADIRYDRCASATCIVAAVIF